MREFSAAAEREWRDREYVANPPLLLVTFTSSGYNAGAPVRVTPTHEDIVSNGLTYRAAPLRCELPDENERGTTNIRLVLSNAGLEFMPALFAHALADSSVLLEIVRESFPDDLEWSSEFFVDSVVAKREALSVNLSRSALLNSPACQTIYTANTAAGLF